MLSRVSAMLLLVILASAQDPKPPAFHVQSDLALITFSVAGKHKLGRDLRADDILVLEDGVQQKIAFLENARTTRNTPIDVYLLFDCGPQMRRGLLVSSHVIPDNFL